MKDVFITNESTGKAVATVFRLQCIYPDRHYELREAYDKHNNPIPGHRAVWELAVSDEDLCSKCGNCRKILDDDLCAYCKHYPPRIEWYDGGY